MSDSLTPRPYNHLRATALPTTQLSHPPTLSRCPPVFTTPALLATAYGTLHRSPCNCPAHNRQLSNPPTAAAFPSSTLATLCASHHHSPHPNHTHHTPSRHYRLFPPRDGFPIDSSLNRTRIRRVPNVSLPRFKLHSLRSLCHWRQNRPLLHRGEAHEGRPLAEHAAIANDDRLR